MKGRGGILHCGASPAMLFVPCMMLEEAKDWKDEGYKAGV